MTKLKNVRRMQRERYLGHLLGLSARGSWMRFLSHAEAVRIAYGTRDMSRALKAIHRVLAAR